MTVASADIEYKASSPVNQPVIFATLCSALFLEGPLAQVPIDIHQGGADSNSFSHLGLHIGSEYKQSELPPKLAPAQLPSFNRTRVLSLWTQPRVPSHSSG